MALAVVLTAFPAQAQDLDKIGILAATAPCYSRETFEAVKLAGKFHPVGTGVAHDGKLIQRLKSDAGAWLLFVITPENQYCSLAYGMEWRVEGPGT